MNKKYILFDLDGTLTDSKLGITKSVQYALSNFGIQVNDLNELLPFIGPPLMESFQKYYGFNDENIDKVIAKYREYYGEKGIFENTLYEGMDTLLQMQHQSGKTLALATSKPTFYAEKILKHFNIDKYFSFVAGSELDGQRSNKDMVIQYALDNLGITSKHEVIMIGDRKHDIIGAKEIGVDSIGILHGYGDYNELSDAGADYIVKDSGELAELLSSGRLYLEQ